MHSEKQLLTEFIDEAYKHCKATIYSGKDIEEVYNATRVNNKRHEDINTAEGDSDLKFISAIAKYRVWGLGK